MLIVSSFPGFVRAALVAAALSLTAVPSAAAEGGAAVMDLARLAPDGSVRPAMDVAGKIDRALTPEAVMMSGLEQFRPAARHAPQFHGRDGDVWLRFQLVNSSQEDRSAKFVLRFPYLEQVDLFERSQDDTLKHSTAGSAAALTGDAVAAAYPAFHLFVPAGERHEYYVRIRSESLIIVPVAIESELDFSRRVTIETLVWSLIIGAALAFAIYAGSMSLDAANGAFRVYMCFALSAAVYTLLASGLLNAVIGAGLSVNFTRMVFFAQALTVALAAMFIMTFLNTEQRAKQLHRLFYGIAFIGVLTGVSFLFPVWLSRIGYYAATGAGPILIAAGLAWLAFRGAPGARCVFLAWLPCLAATVLIYLRILDLTPYVPINQFLTPLAFALTLAVLSAVLGGRVRQAELWANSDPMTGLSNRRFLSDIAALESRQPGERYGAAVAIDLDRFKTVNDAFGRAAGDSVILAMAERLRVEFTGCADIFRVGGDKFLVLGYSSVSRMEIITRANSFLQASRQPVQHADHHISISASAGIAFHDHAAGFVGMLKQADGELYHMKASGRSGIRIADQRQRNRRHTEPVLFADNDEYEDAVARLFSRG